MRQDGNDHKGAARRHHQIQTKKIVNRTGKPSYCKITTTTICLFFGCVTLGLFYLASTVHKGGIPAISHSVPTSQTSPTTATIPPMKTTSTPNTLTHSRISTRNTTLAKSKQKAKELRKTVKKQTLSVPANTLPPIQIRFPTSTFTSHIYLTWCFHSDLFNYINYKSLESLLAIYPLANVHIQIIAPEPAEYYKVGNILSKQTFQKYIKNGLRIQVEIIHMGIQMVLRQSLPGFAFWREALNQYNRNNHITIMGKTMHVPFHVTFHHILITLYDTGGFYSDFAWFHVKEVLSTDRMDVVAKGNGSTPLGGFDLRWNCVENSSSDNCYASYILLYTKQNPVLYCMLTNYEDPVFLQCMNSNDNKISFDCILKELQSCHQKHHLDANILKANIAENSNNIDTRSSSLPIVSLGETAFTATWERLSVNTALGKWIEEHNKYLQTVGFQHMSSKFKGPLYSLDNNPYPKCSHYFADQTMTQIVQNQALASCAIHFVMPGFMKAGSSFLFDTIMVNHPMLVRTLRGVQFKESGCYMPEKMKNSNFNRMQCFPFLEEQDYKYYGDATVYYAGRKEIPAYLLKDNPEIKVIFTIRNPVSRSISQHRFDYEAFRNKGYANFNDLIAFALNKENGRLMLWYEKALEITKERNLERKVTLRLELLELFKEGLSPDSVSTMYKKCANVILNSLYFLHIFLWYQSIPLRNLRVINVEKIYVRNIYESDKVRGLKLVPIVHQFNTSALLQSSSKQQSVDHRLDNQQVHEKKSSRISNTDHKYLLYQFNAIYKFMGLPEVNRNRILLGGGHESEAIVPPSNQINSTTKQKLEEFYTPFIILLDNLMSEMREELNSQQQN